MRTDIGVARITVRQSGVVMPIVDHAVPAGSELASRGLLIEHHTVGKSEFPRREVQSHIVYMHTGASVQAEIESLGFSGRKWLRRGLVWVMPQGSEHAVRFNGGVRGVALSFAPERFEQLIASIGAMPARELQERFITDQPKLEYLMRALADESAQPNEPGLLTIECIATAIALTLCEASKAQKPKASGLTGRQIEAVTAFVRAHVSEPISLQSLADLVSRSPFHFLRAFKRSTGMTPHQYVIEQRMEAAKRLLRVNKLTIGEVGAIVGFAHQSHFARAFRSYAGVTPSEFAKSC